MSNEAPPPELSDKQRWQALLRGQIISATTVKFSRGVQLADQKAQALILLNSILVPLALNWIEKPEFHYPAIISIITAMCSILAAIICIYPKRKKGRREKNTFNYLHFNDIGHMKRDEFMSEFMPIFNDAGKLAETAIKDLHDTAKNAMIPKFFWLKLAYATFFIGNLIAVIWSVSTIIGSA
ncbi:MAG: Pycsar system effector family protein [Alphaproteobacteria bacterium]